MRYGVFSDVHGNYEALTAVLAKFERNEVGGYIFCGDLIGYGPQPQECAELIKKLPNLTCVMGNHDKALLDPALMDFFTDEARIPIRLANNELSKENFEFISQMPVTYQGPDFAMVHGTFFDPFKEYLLTGRQFKLNSKRWEGNMCFVGHTHIPFIITSKEETAANVELFPAQETMLQLSKENRYLINPGSVGQPRDGDTRASAGIFDTDNFSFKLIRVPYRIDKTQDLMVKHNFAPRLVERLENGL